MIPIDHRHLPRREMLPPEQGHHHRPLIRQVLKPGHIEQRKVPDPRPVLSRGVRVCLVPGRMRRDLKVQHHPGEQCPAQRKSKIADQFFEAEISHLRIVQHGHKDERMKGGKVLDEGPSPHEDHSCELAHGNVPEDQLLQARLRMGFEKLLIDPDDSRVVDQVEEEEVIEDPLADVPSRCLDYGGGGGVPDDGVDADPGEELEDIVHALRPHEPTASQQKKDHRGGSNDRPVYVKRSNDGHHQKREQHLCQVVQFHDRCRLTKNVVNIGDSRTNHQRSPPPTQSVQQFIDDQHVEAEQDLSQRLHFLKREGEIGIG